MIAYKDLADNIAGAAPMLVQAIAKDSKGAAVELKFMGSWADAQAAARDGKADMMALRHLL